VARVDEPARGSHRRAHHRSGSRRPGSRRRSRHPRGSCRRRPAAHRRACGRRGLRSICFAWTSSCLADVGSRRSPQPTLIDVAHC
jgi:hypothetical protein